MQKRLGFMVVMLSLFVFPVSSSKDKIASLALRRKASVRLYSVRPKVQMPGKALAISDVVLGQAGDQAFWENSGWMLASRQEVANFSALAWNAAARISIQAGRPIGIIQLAVGGAPVESFLSLEFASSFLSDGKSWLESVDYPAWCRDRASLNLSQALEAGYSLDQCFHYFMPGAIAPQIHKFSSLPIKAIFWYQGESNAPESGHPWYTGAYKISDSYAKYNRLIDEIDLVWSYEMPFFTVQLPSMERNWPLFREMQAEVAKNRGRNLVVTLDTGDRYDVHPRSKKIVADRLADSVLANVYDIKSPVSPQFIDQQIVGNQIMLGFTQEIVARGIGPLGGFQIAGENLKFVEANIKADRENLIVWHPEIPEPRYVRYAWAGFSMAKPSMKIQVSPR